MMRRSLTYYLLLFFTFLCSFPVSSQFYNGHQMNFGKNRVQYGTFYWKFYRFDRYDVYSYEEGTELSLIVADIVEKELSRIERYFDYNFERRLIFITYHKLSDFRQSNIGQDLNEEEASNTGGVTRIIQNKIFLYYEGDYQKLKQQITQTIAEALIYEMLYGNDFKNNFTSSTLMNIPEWYLKGLISYVSNPWDFEIENRVRDGIISGRYEKFNRLSGVDALYAGHSFWKYVGDMYGESVIPSILYITRIHKNTNRGFLYVLGFPMKELSNDWLGYYINMFTDAESLGELPSDGKILKKTKKKRVYQQVKYSPDGRHIAWTTNELGQYRIYLHDLEEGKTRKILKREHRIDQITDYSYPILSWHPSGKILAFITEEKGMLKLNYYTLEDREFSVRNLLFFHKVLDFSYSHDGLKFVLSAVYKGQVDLYVHDIVSSTNERITNDLADDFNPRFINNSKEIIFTSNRKYDEIFLTDDPQDNLMDHHNVFVCNYAQKDNELKRITERPFINRKLAFEIKNNQFTYLSDESGIVNRYHARFDSTIAFIDTTIHYRYFSRSYPLTNYRRNILEHDYVPSLGKYAEILFNKGQYGLYKGELDPSENLAGEIRLTPFREEYSRTQVKEDSISNVVKQTVALQNMEDNRFVVGTDTLKLDIALVDINNYIFEKEKLNYYNEKLAGENIQLVLDTLPKQQRRRMYIDYETSFFPNFLVNQVDFSFLNASYQTFTGGAVYYNPGLNMMFKVGANDLFEDYRIIGGMRLATDFDSNEFLFSFENLKKRLDRQMLLHRQIFKTSTEYSLLKTITHEAFYILKYPLNQVTALKGSVIFRHDRTVFLSTDLQNLNEKDIFKPWLGLRGEYIFDNTRFLGVNLYTGWRYKIFAEGYKNVIEKKSDLIVVGVDFRHYTRIHRTLIWANRFAASSSVGNTPLIYYLGSVDNWTNFSSRVETFDRSIPIDYSRNYAYQTLATNMRGFTQNIRNGNNFALVNTELRWPVVRYFANHPISSSFWNNFQVTGFFDIGTAWTGVHPWQGRNAYDTEEYENGPILVVIDSNREPIVAGYGWGLRSRVFGYFLRLDWAWGIENRTILPRIFYLSLNLDF